MSLRLPFLERTFVERLWNVCLHVLLLLPPSPSFSLLLPPFPSQIVNPPKPNPNSSSSSDTLLPLRYHRILFLVFFLLPIRNLFRPSRPIEIMKKSLFFCTISYAFFFVSFAGAALVVDHIHGGDSYIPRPVVVEYSDVESLASGNDDVRLWCESWRFAGEANNLGPWTTVPVECAGYVKSYMTGKKYAFDLEMTSREASRFARSVQIKNDGMDAWVFDIDETLLSNLPYYAEHRYGLEIFDHGLFDKWVEKAVAPPIESSLKLYEEILGFGFKVFLLTGRSEAHRSITVENLNRAGFRDWERLILRSLDDRKKSATIYKSEKRDELIREGYRLYGNSGDQWSDLVGSSTSHRSFKLPNSMYYIP